MLNLDDSDDPDIMNEDLDDITEIESNPVTDNLDDLQALIQDTKSKKIDPNSYLLGINLTFFC